MATPEEVANDCVRLPAGPGASHVELRAPGTAPVWMCGHANPAVVREYAEAVRRFPAAVIRADRAARSR
jgi:hypothetical protein